MTKNRTLIVYLILFSWLLGSCGPGEKAADKPLEALSFSIQKGPDNNIFYRQGNVSAHMVLTSGSTPHFITAFPAGNSGVSLRMEKGERPVSWRQIGDVIPLRLRENGYILHGIEVQIEVPEGQLILSEAVLGSVRHIQMRQRGEKIPHVLFPEMQIEGQTLSWFRERIDEQSAYKLSLELLSGSIQRQGDRIKLQAENGPLRLKIRALTGDEPLTPLPVNALLKGESGDLLAAQMLSFLSYEEKFLAGSWQSLAYGGRDTLLFVRLLMPALKPEAVEAALGSVLRRLSSTGEVAHDEEIGEFALFRNRDLSGIETIAPIYDYYMLDDNYLLAPVLAAYAFEHEDGLDRIDAFLDMIGPNGESNRAIFARNMRYIVTKARLFGDRPQFEALVHLRDGSIKGQWRDSAEGLASAEVSYDINVVFVPAALEAINRLANANIVEGFTEAKFLERVWKEEAPKFFQQSVDIEDARREIEAYANRLAIAPDKALNALEGLERFDYDALGLKRNGEALPVLHSDVGFALLFLKPDETDLRRYLESVARPFPAGLMSDAGMFVANPALADEAIENLLTRGHQHGVTIWSWQQALLAAGLKRQYARADLSAETKIWLKDIEQILWRSIDGSHALRSSGFWSWEHDGGPFKPVPFTHGPGRELNPNAAQLSSTIYLAIKR